MNFTTDEALSILNSTEKSEVQDQYEDLVFSWKQKYLMIIPPVKLIQSQIQKINRLNEAYQHFYTIDYQNTTIDNENDISLPLIIFLNNYQQSIAEIKHLISNSLNGFELVENLNRLITIESRMCEKLSAYFVDIKFDFWDKVKVSEHIDIFAAEQELKVKGITESEIINYLRAQIERKIYPTNSVLANLVLKAQKANDYGYK